MKKPFSRLLFCTFLALALAGVQLVAHSPLHQHTSHTVECGLCHAEHAAALISASNSSPLPTAVVYTSIPSPVSRPLETAWPGFHSRAPPPSLT